jgi:hypothetical protein
MTDLEIKDASKENKRLKYSLKTAMNILHNIKRDEGYYFEEKVGANN